MVTIDQLKEIFNLIRNNKKTVTIISGLIFGCLRYLGYQIEYYKGGWEKEKEQHWADIQECNTRLKEKDNHYYDYVQRSRSQDSVNMQRLMDEAFKNANERILQPKLDSIRKS